MKFGYQTNTWGGVVGHPAGVTSIKDLFYLTNGSNEDAVSDISNAGYEGIEIFDGNLYQYGGEITKFKELLEEKQVSLIAVYSGANFIYEDILADELWRIEESAKLAKAFGAEYLVVGGGAIRSTGTLPEDFINLAKGLDKVVEIANHYGLEAHYHPHLGTIGQSPEQIDRIFELTAINFCPDTAHLVAGGADLISIVSKYIDKIKYIHFKDYINGDFLPLGAGQLPLDSLAQLLVENNYDGWVTVELDYYHGHPRDGAVISKRYLESIFK